MSITDMISGLRLSSLSNGWELILLILRKFHNWVRLPGRSFVDKASGRGDHSDNVNAALSLGSSTDKNAWTISSVSKMNPKVIICLFSVRDSFCVASRFWLPCHTSEKSWSLAILCDFHSSASFFICDWFSVLNVSNAGSTPVNIPLLAWAHCLTTTVSEGYCLWFLSASSR